MKKLLTLLLIALSATVSAQEFKEARKILDTLTSASFWGRGYTKNGMGRTADYLSNAFKAAGLQPVQGTDFKQYFSYPVNTFPGKMEVSIDGKKLRPGLDFIVAPSSSGKKVQTRLQKKDSVTFIAPAERILLQISDKLTWSVAQSAEDYTGLQVDKKAVSKTPENINVDIENLFIPEFKASNICGMVKGTKHPDSILLITAHYDHLGGMGNDTFFPGANDNASGISLLLSLARYYGANPAPFTLVFIGFAGEEAGILGSQYFTQHPLIALDKIRFMINVDMVGTGDTGITVVNATLHPKEFSLLNEINDKDKYLVKINPRGKAANSDHYFFTEKGVPAFFIYTQGGIQAYHDVNDQAGTLPLNEFTDLYHLILAFNKKIMD